MESNIRLPNSKLAESVDSILLEWDEQDVSRRIWDKDHTVWRPDPTELSNRLGWLDLPEESVRQLGEIEQFAGEVLDDGIKHVVLLGMGGSSLAPEVFGEIFGSQSPFPQLVVLDTTHPDAVRVVDNAIDPASTLFVVSSKSGSTLETLSLFRTFWDRVSRDSATPGNNFAAITDPGSALEQLAADRHFRQVFQAPPSVGGRYSALSVFGLAPAALVGTNVAEMLASARAMAVASSGAVRASQNPCLRLGVTLAALAKHRMDKLTFLCSPTIESFPAWIEQLVAESTGKDGVGIVPIDGENPMFPDSYSRDRVFVGLSFAGDGHDAIVARLAELEAAGHPVIHLPLADKLDLGAEMFRWELATAAAGAVLAINPFDQPDVQLAKSLAKEAMESRQEETGGRQAQTLGIEDDTALSDAIGSWAAAEQGDYLAVQAYLVPSPTNETKLQDIRRVLGERLGISSTLGFGPRFLHSTGQLHKGGANNGLFLQFVDEPQQDMLVPETDFTFGALIAAQALGDYRALVQRGRRVLRVNLGADTTNGLDVVRSAVA